MRESLKLELQADEGTTPARIEALCRARIKQIDSIHEYFLGLVALDQGTNYPEELVPYIEEELGADPKRTALILIPSPTKRPEIRMFPVSSLYGRVANALEPYVPDSMRSLPSGSPELLVLLTFRSADTRNCLDHPALLGHEMMHYRDYREQISEKLIDREAVGIPAPRLQHLIASGSPTNEAQTVVSVKKQLKSWMMEIVADLLAVHKYGPAAVLALGRVAESEGLHPAPSETHPDWPFRLRLMLSELQYLGYTRTAASAEAIEDLLGDLEDWTARSGIAYAPTTPIHDEVRAALDRANLIIREEIRARAGPSYRIDQYLAEVPRLADALVFGCPPSEFIDLATRSVTPATVAGVFNAAQTVWRYRSDEFVRQLRDPSTITEGETLSIMSRLVLKALESITFYRAAGRS